MPDIAEITKARPESGGVEHLSRHDLYALAKEKQIPGRSKMSREELAEALRQS